MPALRAVLLAGIRTALRHLQQHELDPAAWDACLQASGEALPYGSYAWLRAVANGRFSALVWEDDSGYEAIFPLPERRKAWLLPYVAMTPFTQRLGLFARPGADRGRMASEASRYLGRHFLRVDMAVTDELLARTLSGQDRPLRNLILLLDSGPDTLHAGLSQSLRQKLRQAQAAGLVIEQTPTALTAFRFIRAQLAPRLPAWDKAYDYAWGRLPLVPGALFQIRGSVAMADGQPVAAGVFVDYGPRTIFLAGASNATGLETGAMALLLWRQIEARAGQPGGRVRFRGRQPGRHTRLF